MLGEVLRVLGDRTAVEVGDAEVEEDIEKVGEVEERLVSAVGGITEQVLHFSVDAENPEGLHQQVEKQQEDDIFDEAVLHSKRLGFRGKIMKKKILNCFSSLVKEIMCIFTPELSFLK